MRRSLWIVVLALIALAGCDFNLFGTDKGMTFAGCDDQGVCVNFEGVGPDTK